MGLHNQNPSDRLSSFFDEGTFTEIAAHIKRNDDMALAGVICGYGSLDGKLVFAFSQQSDRALGAFDTLHAKKLTMLIECAVKNGAPLVGFFDSVGALVNEGTAVLAAYGQVMKALSEASGVIPTVAVVSGICGGTSAVFASMFDIVISSGNDAHLYLTPGQEKDGIFAIKADNEADALTRIRTLLSLIPSNNAGGFAIEEGDLQRVVLPSLAEGRCDNRTLITELADDHSVVELYPGSDGMIIAFARIGGMGVGIFANDSTVDGGRITCKGARKAAKLLSFCDSFGIPVLSLTDSDGLSEEACPASLSKLAMTYLSSSMPKITLVTGNAVGAAFVLMGAKSCGADVVFALPGATISTLPPASAVAFLWNDRVGKEARTSLEKTWREEHAIPALAAEIGEVDDVIEKEELRPRLCAALMMLAGKAERPCRKHVNFPL